MEKVYTSRRAQDNYIYQLQDLVDRGDYVEVRGRTTLELMNVMTVVEEPWHHCILLPARRWNPWLALSEALWILAGRNDVAALAPYNSRISDFSDDGVSLYGAYGARMVRQIDPLIERLRWDSSDRRAVLQIWNAYVNFDGFPDDLNADTKDPPCNNLVYFKLRQNELHMTVICRSNDIHWGLYAVNLPTFGLLQEYIAARLHVLIGSQTHLSNSLHVYTDNEASKAITDRMLYGRENDRYIPYPRHKIPFEYVDVESHEEFAAMCSAALENIVYDSHPFLEFASEFLDMYREHKWEPSKLSHADDYVDWVTAADIWVSQVWKHEKLQAT